MFSCPTFLFATVLFASSVSSAESSCSVQTLVVNVRDSSGAFVDNLPPAAFRADTKVGSVTISSAKSVFPASRMVIVIDASGSMSSGSRFWAGIKTAAEQLLKSTSDATKVGFIAFGSSTINALNIGHSKSEIFAAIEQLAGMSQNVASSHGQGLTALWDALLQAHRMFANPQPGDSVVVISDGGDNHSKFQDKDVERAYLKDGIRLFAVVIQSGFLTQEEINGAESLVSIARATGGGTAADSAKFRFDVKPSDSAYLKRLVEEISDEQSRFYILELAIAERLEKPARWHLDIVGPNGKRRRDVSVFYPPRLASCSTLQVPQ